MKDWVEVVVGWIIVLFLILIFILILNLIGGILYFYLWGLYKTFQ